MRVPTGDDSEREVAKRGRCRGRGGKSWLGYILERTTISRSKKLWLLVLSGAHAGVSARLGLSVSQHVSGHDHISPHFGSFWWGISRSEGP